MIEKEYREESTEQESNNDEIEILVPAKKVKKEILKEFESLSKREYREDWP